MKENNNCLKRRFTFTIVIVLVFSQFINSFAFADSISQEYQLKAAFLYKFINFIEWSYTQKEPVQICVLGENPFGDILDQIIAVKDPHFQHAQTLMTENTSHLSSCGIIFISHSEEKNLSSILVSLNTFSVVTVSDIVGFARKGGMIELTLEGSSVKFIINQRQAKTQGIKISAQLLSLAKYLITES